MFYIKVDQIATVGSILASQGEKTCKAAVSLVYGQ